MPPLFEFAVLLVRVLSFEERRSQMPLPLFELAVLSV
jgi:hypothetical protein